ncbi:MAG: heme-binding domain-containing protein [Alphaproteobacteria bacterium]|nr:heme-binding domain-containing protein [Alphaproteobacteria bacterium]
MSFRALFPFLLAIGCALPDNPPVTREIEWIDAETEALARRACYDCHSNETVWKGGHRVPVVNSLVRSDVKRGRCKMNFSEWDGPNEDAWDAPSELLDGEMPLGLYLKTHEHARLTDDEVQALADGLNATFELDPPLDGERCED